VAKLQWQGDGPDFTIHGGGRPWRLNLGEPQPALRWSNGRSVANILGLRYVSTTGRRDEEACNESSLLTFERHRSRIQATFAPRAWHGLTVRAAWEPTPAHDGLDLEIQVSVTSRGVLRRLEVAIGSRWSETTGSSPPDIAYRVEPRDAHAAAITYDGREPPSLLHSLTTMPVPSTSPHTLPPHVRRESGVEPGRLYVEMVRPNDCARRIIGEMARPGATAPMTCSIRYGLFGHDLEKGVVLRGRIRGVWIDASAPEDEVRRQHEAFLSEPPALGP
jgi:hypothetical protein